MDQTGGINEKHIKGFMYDSLIYRFKNYQAKALWSDVEDLIHNKGYSKVEARRVAQDRHNRDLMRFIQILNEAIGEHD